MYHQYLLPERWRVGTFNPLSDAKVLLRSVKSSPMSLLLLCVPIGIASGMLHWSASLTFAMVCAPCTLHCACTFEACLGCCMTIIPHGW